MPDITMCSNGCKDANRCYRFTAEPDPHWQFFMEAPAKDKKSCDMFISNRMKAKYRSLGADDSVKERKK